MSAPIEQFLDEFRGFEAAATPGPWGSARDLAGVYMVQARPRVIPGVGMGSDGDVAVIRPVGSDGETYANARFIAMAREAAPALLAEVARQAREIERLTARVRELERPAVEAERAEIRSSYTELISQAEQDRDYEGAFEVQCRLRDREQQWTAEDAKVPADTAIFPDGRAAFLARKLGEERAVVSATAINATTVDLHVRPASLDEWEWWQRRFHVEPGTATHRGSFATAAGTFGTSLRVLLTGDGVGALYAAERDRIGGAR